MSPEDHARLFLRQALLEAPDQKPSLTVEKFGPGADPMIDLFDVNRLRARLPTDGVTTGEADSDFEIGSRPRRVSDEQFVWEARIADIIRDPRGAKRRLVVASQPLLGRLEALRTACPGFEAIVDLVLRAAYLSMASKSQLKLPPMLLTGPPGIGKTHFARRLAEALGVPAKFVSMDMLTDRGTLTGLNTSWKGAKPGAIAETLLAADVVSPLIVLDEVDKVSPIHMREEPLAFLHTVLEPISARAFTDDYLSFPIRADFCFWILSVNDQTALAPSILDRLLILNIREPSPSTMRTIARNIYQDANAEQENWFEPEPTGDLLIVLVQTNPRRARRILEVAMGFAAQEGRRVLTQSDVRAGSMLVEAHKDAREKVGFVSRQPGES